MQKALITIEVALPLGDLDTIADELDVILADTIMEFGGEIIDVREYEELT